MSDYIDRQTGHVIEFKTSWGNHYTTPTRRSVRLAGKSKLQRFFIQLYWWINGRPV